jgi:hypothetical protein
MSKTNVWTEKWMRWFFCNTAITSSAIGSNWNMAATTNSASFWFSLHTGSFGDPSGAPMPAIMSGSNYHNKEANYGGYLRGDIPRKSTTWAFTSGSAGVTMTNIVPITCGTARTTGVDNIPITHWAISSWHGNGTIPGGGADMLYYVGVFDPPLYIVSGSVAISILSGSLAIHED